MSTTKNFVCEHIDVVPHVSNITITADDVRNSLKKTKLGKSAGIDGLAVEHFICPHTSITVHLSLLFSCMLTHGCIPDSFMKTLFFCILKYKNDDTSAKSNYRPIAIVKAMSKVFELCLSRIMDVYLFISDNQIDSNRNILLIYVYIQ